MFSSPAFLVGSALATLWASLFHLLFGKRLPELVWYWFIALIGFALGQAVGTMLNWRWLLVGQVHMLEGTLVCWLAMLIARWLKV